MLMSEESRCKSGGKETQSARLEFLCNLEGIHGLNLPSFVFSCYSNNCHFNATETGDKTRLKAEFHTAVTFFSLVSTPQHPVLLRIFVVTELEWRDR